MTCSRCQERGKTWSGDDPVCGFPEGVFDPANWNCATLNALRELGEPIWIDDEHVLIVQGPRGFLLMRWYKQRGRTMEAYWWGRDAPHPLTLIEAEQVLTGGRDG